ncbi:MAG: SUMF1/EgtB/PvdO family nonheme iron enzyme [Cytophagaceae bacterium]|nr:SUMF1/EgtB/PvdO family nonheme iron enzyme [Cytophagaceae bacterium]
MGSPSNEPVRRYDETQVAVTLTRGFWMGKYEVPQGQWKRVIGEYPDTLRVGIGDDFPMHTVSYIEAEGFCRKLTSKPARRGGAWIEEGCTCRSAYRIRYEPERRSDHIGFRIAIARTR